MAEKFFEKAKEAERMRHPNAAHPKTGKWRRKKFIRLTPEDKKAMKESYQEYEKGGSQTLAEVRKEFGI